MTDEVQVTKLAAQPAAAVSGRVTQGELEEFLGGAFNEVMGVLAAQGRTPAGPPFGRYQPRESGFDVVAGFPLSEAITPTGRVQAEFLPGGLVASLLYRGPYSGIGAAYEAVQEWLGKNGLGIAGEPRESYLDEPHVAEPRTLVQFPCARK